MASTRRAPQSNAEFQSRLRQWAELRRKFKVLYLRKGCLLNYKRTESVYRVDGFSLRLKEPRKRGSHLRVVLGNHLRVKEQWSMDFAADNQRKVRG